MTNERRYLVTIGGFTHEGITTSLGSIGLNLLDLSLTKVKPPTWIKRAEKLQELHDGSKLCGTIMYLHTHLFLRAAQPEYRSAFFAIVEKMRLTKSLIFAFQDNLEGIFSRRNRETGEPWTLEELKEAAEQRPSFRAEKAIETAEEAERLREQLVSFTEELFECGVEIAPFYVRTDVTLRFQEFLEDLDGGVFLRLYIPFERYQADQMNGLFAVLERYLVQVEKKSFAIDERKSEKGVTYVFRMKDSRDGPLDLNGAFDRFDLFMKACGDNAKDAESLITNFGHSAEEASRMVTKFAKERQRLLLDCRHEQEQKLLSLKQRFEAEILETSDSNSRSAIATVSQNAEGVYGGLSSQILGQSVSFIFNGPVGKVIHGVDYNDMDATLIQLFEKCDERVFAAQLRSDLDQLKDPSVPAASKTTAKQRILAFLQKGAKYVGQLAEKVSINVLAKYVQDLASQTTGFPN